MRRGGQASAVMIVQEVERSAAITTVLLYCGDRNASGSSLCLERWQTGRRGGRRVSTKYLSAASQVRPGFARSASTWTSLC